MYSLLLSLYLLFIIINLKSFIFARSWICEPFILPQAHRETDRFLTDSGVQLEQTNFHFHRVELSSQIKSTLFFWREPRQWKRCPWHCVWVFGWHNHTSKKRKRDSYPQPVTLRGNSSDVRWNSMKCNIKKSWEVRTDSPHWRMWNDSLLFPSCVPCVRFFIRTWTLSTTSE